MKGNFRLHLLISLLFTSFQISCITGNDSSKDDSKQAIATSSADAEQLSVLTLGDSLFLSKKYKDALAVYSKIVYQGSKESLYNSHDSILNEASLSIAKCERKLLLNEAAKKHLDSLELIIASKPQNLDVYRARLWLERALILFSEGLKDSCTHLSQKAIELLTAHKSYVPIDEFYFEMYRLAYEKTDDAESLRYCLLSKQYMSMQDSANANKLFSLYTTLLSLYGYSGKGDSAVIAAKELLQTESQLNKVAEPIRAEYYSNIGKFYSDLHMIDKALLYQRKANLSAIACNDSLLIARSLLRIGRAMEKMGYLKTGIKYYLRSDSIYLRMLTYSLDTPGDFSIIQGHLFNLYNLTESYEALLEKEKALAYARSAYLFCQQYLPNKQDELGWAATNLCQQFAESFENMDSAAFYASKALSHLNRVKEQDSKDVSFLRVSSFNALALSYLGKFQAALRSCDTVITILKQVHKIEDPDQYDKLQDPEIFALSSDRCSEAYLRVYLATSDTNYLTKSEQCSNWAIAILNNAIQSSDVSYASILMKENIEVLDRLLMLNILKRRLGYDVIDDICGILERQKSFELRQRLFENGLLQQENEDLRFRLAVLRSKRTSLIEAGAYEPSTNPEKKNKIMQVDATIDSISEIMPASLNKKKIPEIHFSLDSVQRMIDDSTLILNFFVTQKKVYALAIDKKGAELTTYNIAEELIGASSQYSRLLTSGDSKSAINQFSYNLYSGKFNNLIDTTKGHKKLIIIPDGELSSISFESLVTYLNQDSVRYLADDFDIRYELCMSFLFNNSPTKNHDDRILAMAPSSPLTVPSEHDDFKETQNENLLAGRSELRSGLGPIKFSVDEVKEIVGHYDGKKLIGKEATEKSFRQEAERYQVLHFAAHAFSDPDNPNLSGILLTLSDSNQVNRLNDLFEYRDDSLEQDNILYAFEIQNLDLKADMVVLSACETAKGRYQIGEGTMSLARAFKYAGCPNIVSSLWKVDDASTKEIMTSFYDNLGKGLGKADALAEAKELFRKQHPNASPFYWAPFILIGDNEPVHLKKRNHQDWWLAGVIFLLVGAAVIYIYRRSKRAA